MRKIDGAIVYSPSDLITYLSSPFASWMDRYHLEELGPVTPDKQTDEQRLIAETGLAHEKAVLGKLSADGDLLDLSLLNEEDPFERTRAALAARSPVVYQAALRAGNFAGYADFLILENGTYVVWDTKLAKSPKPYYAVQLCCYSEMLAATLESDLPEAFGVILGNNERVRFRVEDFVHYYRRLKASFLVLQGSFSGNMTDRPEPMPRADHGRLASHADGFLDGIDHMVRVAGISVGQIKKLKAAGIHTLADLSNVDGDDVPKLAADSLAKLVRQARLQHLTRTDRFANSEAVARFELLEPENPAQPSGLAALPPADPADVFFDMEGYPLTPGGLEYLFGATTIERPPSELRFDDWWGHDRLEEKRSFEEFVDWAFSRWLADPRMHIYHYASYEVTALRRLSIFHDTRQEEIDDLLRNEVFVDLYKIVRQGLAIGEESYSIKFVERLYRPKRATEVANAADSIVQYARWMGSGEPADWKTSPILNGIRDYNKDDCDSTAELTAWLRKLAAERGIETVGRRGNEAEPVIKELAPEVAVRLEIAEKLRSKGDKLGIVLADLVDFHRREQKPVFWKMFDRAGCSVEELRDDNGCIDWVRAVGKPEAEKRSLAQTYSFDPNQECKLAAGDSVMFTHRIFADLAIFELDRAGGSLKLKATQDKLDEKFAGAFPETGSLIESEAVRLGSLPEAIADVAERHLKGSLPDCAKSLLERTPPAAVIQPDDESTIDAALRIAAQMIGGCLVIQGPPGTGKTYTAAHLIKDLLDRKLKVGITSNSHKAIANLLSECGSVIRESGGSLVGVKVGGDETGRLFDDNPGLVFAKDGGKAAEKYDQGVIGGTAWVFTRPEFIDALDFLVIDEAGQVSLANAIAMSRSTRNLVLLGDQMQLEQPIQGSHPGDSGLSALQYLLKDTAASKADSPVFHPVVPANLGLFLNESRRMHPGVCSFISESIYEKRLTSFGDCARQQISVPAGACGLVPKETGIIFSPVEHDGNVQRSEEEVERVAAIYADLLGRDFTDLNGRTRELALEDFLFVAPYNAQVRALEAVLPEGARIGSVDRFQGQQAPVCVLSLCSSFGEYGSRGLAFILDRNRLNVAISRAQCLAIIVGDPRIAGSPASSLNEMMLLNLMCKLTDPAL